MHFYKIAVAALVHSQTAIFTYHSSTLLPRGMVVRVPIGKKYANGIVFAATKKPSFPTKQVTLISEKYVLPDPLLRLAEWISIYYVAHLGLVIQSLLPPGLHKKRRKTSIEAPRLHRKKKAITLTPAQEKALSTIFQNKESTFLLQGVPGSGKTQVYIEASKKTLAEGKSTIVLVPEIALTAQLIAEFSNHFQNVTVIHSGMSEAERHLAWNHIVSTNEPQIIIGPRSALFSPVANIGLIVVDECHEQSFKQDRSPRYNALFAASKLAKLHRAKVLFGSATPGVIELFLAEQNKMTLLHLSEAIQPIHNKVEIVNHSEKSSFSMHRFVSNQLITVAKKALAKKEQVLIFHNRRGTAPSVICESCGWQALCPECGLPLTYHNDERKLRCHFCNFSIPIVYTCPECKEPTIVFKGIGTKLIESELRKLFPHAHIARFDTDNTKEEQLHSRYQEVYEGNIDIIVGTQIIAKGLDLPRISVVGILQADAGLHLPDFSARERTFQLLYQVSGRAGRDEKEGQVIIQTYLPQHPIINFAAKKAYKDFYTSELAYRQQMHFPPYTFLLKLVYAAKTERAAIKATKLLAQELYSKYKGVEISGPAPAFREQIRHTFQWQIIVKSKKRSVLETIAASLSSKWQYDIDPVSIL